MTQAAAAAATREWWSTRAARTPGYCGRCGLLGTNFVHDTVDERADTPYHKTHPDIPFCDFVPGGVEPPTRRGGAVSIDVSIRVTASEMKNWRPETISTFFAGMAMVEDAVKRGRSDSENDR